MRGTMILLCECERIFSHFLRFCAGAREYFEKNSLKNRTVGEKNFGESRTGGAAALSRELSEFFGPKLFSCNARPPEKISQTAKTRKKFPRPRGPGKNFPDRDAYRTRKTIGPCPLLLPRGNGPPARFGQRV